MFKGVLCSVLVLIPVLAFRAFGGFLDYILRIAGVFTWSLLVDLFEHCVGCDGFFGLSMDVGFGLCHLGQAIGGVWLGIVIAKSDSD